MTAYATVHNAPGHTCRESLNPRHRGHCDCGAPLPQAPTMQRDVQLERDIIEHAARGVMNPDVLIERAQFRASRLSGEYVVDPMLIALDRDRPREVAEELEDGVNHLVWWLQAHPDHPLAPQRMGALTNMLAAYSLLALDE